MLRDSLVVCLAALCFRASTGTSSAVLSHSDIARRTVGLALTLTEARAGRSEIRMPFTVTPFGVFVFLVTAILGLVRIGQRGRPPPLTGGIAASSAGIGDDLVAASSFGAVGVLCPTALAVQLHDWNISRTTRRLVLVQEAT